jgi:HNH endonuclease
VSQLRVSTKAGQLQLQLQIGKKLRDAFNISDDVSDEDALRILKNLANRVCKPCWELKYCPYGPLVEDFPFIPLTRGEVLDFVKREKKLLEKGKYPNGRELTKEMRSDIGANVAEIERDIDDYPVSIPSDIREMSCKGFGHICPVSSVAENCTETAEERLTGRHIPFKTQIRITRRDNYTCQICGKHLKDGEIEFDHIIPLSKGGSSEEHNLQLTCFSCNRAKSNKSTQ